MAGLVIMAKPVSGMCNMHCGYCFYADVSENREVASFGRMSDATLENMVRKGFLYPGDSVQFTFQGGEPLLAGIGFYEKLLALERRYNTRGTPVWHTLQTNGLAINGDWIQLFREGGFLIGVSLDGTRALHDEYRKDQLENPTYDRILSNLKELHDAHVEYNILCVVREQIAREPKAVWNTLKEHRYLQFIPCLDAFDGEMKAYSLQSETYGAFLVEIFDLYERAWQRGRPVSERTFDNWIGMLLGHPPESCAMCGRCGHYFLMEADGSVYPCDFYALDEWRLGSINQTSFQRMETCEAARKFRALSVPLDPQCLTCKWYFLCRGGCRREREPIVNGVPQRFRLCEGYKMFFEARFPKLERLAHDIARMRSPKD